eukprot:NODE_96_length_20709_cov_1.429161.p15 type:complete len:156 gc:universal NODE_96_length_20709_cov_1.429161:10165-9698(-)
MALSFNPKRLHNYIQHDVITKKLDYNRSRSTVPLFMINDFANDTIQRPNTTIGRLSPIQEKMEKMAMKKKALVIQTSFSETDPVISIESDLSDSPIVRSQNPLLQSPISRSQNPLLSPMTSSPQSSVYETNGRFIRRASCLSTSTSTSSRFSQFQ